MLIDYEQDSERFIGKREVYFSVDIETAGPNPSTYSLLSIGACTLQTPRSTFYIELKPFNDNAIHSAVQISHLSLNKLAQAGVEPAEAMARFETWVLDQLHEGEMPVFLAFNAPFDWMFVNDYFHRYLGRNPFGHSALDMKAVYMGLFGVSWAETSMRYVSKHLLEDRQLTHQAARDAMDQADIFVRMLAIMQSKKKVLVPKQEDEEEV